MGFVNELSARTSFNLFVLMLSLRYFLSLGPSNGHTRGVLSVSTSATLACRPLAWFLSVLVLFLSPFSLLVATLLYNPTALAFKHDPRSVGMAISLISAYWGLTLLTLGSCSTKSNTPVLNQPTGQVFAPRWFVFDRIFYYHIAWRHRSHVSFVRQDRMRRFVAERPFTVFVLGEGQVSIPIGMFGIFLV